MMSPLIDRTDHSFLPDVGRGVTLRVLVVEGIQCLAKVNEV